MHEKALLIFVYNADSGLFNTLSDIAHKIFAPDTYACNLCKLTHGNLRMRDEWKSFIEGLAMPMEFLHRDELHARFGMRDIELPAVLLQSGDAPELLVDAASLTACEDLAALKALLSKALAMQRDVQ